MSEYLRKKAVLEWLKKEASSGDSDIWNKNFNYGLKYVMKNIRSGAFDATEVNSEVQRLRAALERIVTVYEECDCTAKDLYLIAVNEVGSKQPVENEVHEALSPQPNQSGLRRWNG